jgi:diaminohydroxyphosphoribosylaminopyrimidine deaminase/5-amino-6-(5-phosphoribosylamino)uracil reductase
VGTGTLVATAADDAGRVAALSERGAEIVVLADAYSKVDLKALMQELARRGHNEVHVEAGSGLNGALLEAGLVDELLIYLAPLVLGEAARGMFALEALETLQGARRFRMSDVRRVGEDVRLIARAEG